MCIICYYLQKIDGYLQKLNVYLRKLNGCFHINKLNECTDNLLRNNVIGNRTIYVIIKLLMMSIHFRQMP